jgi:sarcosine oxidase
MSVSSCVVVGAGLAGAAIAWQLAGRGVDVTVVERSHPANREGSSHGSARIFRYAYADSFYVELVVRSRAGFDELERLSGRELIRPSGSLDFGEVRDPAALARALEAVGVEHELLSASEASQRWPQIAFDTEVLWHPGAGVIDAEGTVHEMLAAATRDGARVLTDWPVRRVAPQGTGYRVESDAQVVEAEQVIVAAGGWLPNLLDQLPLGDAFRAALPRFRVTQENVYHFPYRDDAPSEATGGPLWPTFIHRNDAIYAYGLPGGRDAGFAGQKLAEFHGGRVIPSAAHQDGRVDPVNRARIVDYVKAYVPGLRPEPYAETTCLFTNTPSEDFLIDGVEGFTVVSPCSGHGAKFAPLIGEIVADAVTGVAAVPDRFTAAAFGAAGHT